MSHDSVDNGYVFTLKPIEYLSPGKNSRFPSYFGRCISGLGLLIIIRLYAETYASGNRSDTRPLWSCMQHIAGSIGQLSLLDCRAFSVNSQECPGQRTGR